MMNKQDQDHIGMRLKALYNDMKSYVEMRAELVYINISEHLALTLAQSIHKLIGLLLLLGGVLFLMAALALYIGELVDSRALGYLIVSVPILLVGMMFLALRPKSLNRSLKSRMVSEMMKALPDRKAEKPSASGLATIKKERTDGYGEEKAADSKSGRRKTRS